MSKLGPEGADTRFIVTNLKVRNARVLYEDVYCRRDPAENHIKTWKTHLAADRTSCTKAEANQLRLFLHAGAYRSCGVFVLFVGEGEVHDQHDRRWRSPCPTGMCTLVYAWIRCESVRENCAATSLRTCGAPPADSDSSSPPVAAQPQFSALSRTPPAR